MGNPVNISALQAELDFSELGAIAVETGTFRGGTALALSFSFPRVITIELCPELHRAAKARFSGLVPRIECMQGSSPEILASILPSLPNEPIFFYLDAHWSGDHSVNWNRSAWKGYGVSTAHLGTKGKLPSAEEQCPLEKELRAIVRHCRGPAHILIDDLEHLPTMGPGRKDYAFFGENWSHLSREGLRNVVRERLVSEKVTKNPSRWFLQLREQQI